MVQKQTEWGGLKVVCLKVVCESQLSEYYLKLNHKKFESILMFILEVNSFWN